MTALAASRCNWSSTALPEDHIHGYVAELKYRGSEVASNSGTTDSSTQATPPAARKKLTVPQ
jgi:hypothetical protein